MALNFLFGGNTNETPDSIKRKRDLVRAIMGASNAPRNIGEGLNALGDGIVANVLDRRADAAEKTGTDAASSLFNSIMGTPSTPPTPGATGSAMPAVTPSGDIPVATAPDDVKNLIAANVPPEMQAYATNLIGKESSFNPSAVSPTGATGLAQFTRGTGKQYGLVSDKGDMRADPTANLKALVALTNDNRAGLTQALGRAPTDGELALAHQQGLQGAVNLLSGKSVPANNLAVNNIDPNMDPRAAAGKIMSFYGGSAGPQVASLDQGIGLAQTAPQAINAAATPSGSVYPQMASAGRDPVQGPPRPAPDLPPPTTIANAPQVAAQPAPPQQLAQNTQQPFAGVDPRLLQALSNPFLNQGQRAAVQMLIQQQQQAAQQQQEEQTWRAREDYKLNSQKADPAYQLEQDYKRAQLEALKNKTGKTNLINAGEGNIYDPDTQTWIKAPNAQGQSGEGFRFGGNSVEAQALNGLIEGKQLTVEQAQQLAAGKTISGPNGEMLFLTPQGIFKQDGQSPAQPQPQPPPQQSGPIDLFGDGGQPAAAVSPQGPQSPAQPQNDQIIPLTAPKAASNEQLNAAGFADRMHSAGGLLDKYEQQGLNATDQFLTGSPFIPGVIGNSIVGKTNPDYQLFDQARRDFINAQLRRESGAVIGPDEFNNANKQYFPQPGDSEAVIKQKREARQLAIESMGRSAGPNYKRPVPTGNDADIQAARDAIAKGAPRDKVIKRLQDAGIDTTGL